MSKLSELAYEHQKNKTTEQAKPAFVRLTVAGLAREQEKLLKEQQLQDKDYLMKKLNIPVAVLTNGEALGKALGELTIKTLSIGKGLKTYLTAAKMTYMDTVRKTEIVVEQPSNDVASRMLRGETFDAVLESGEKVSIVKGEIVSIRR